MAGIEVLAPLRIETRFTAPDAAAGRPKWLCRLRVFPDEFSMLRPPPPPSPKELELLNEAIAAPAQDPPIDEKAAFGALAKAVGAARAVWLLRTIARIEVDGNMVADPASAHERDDTEWPATHLPHGLPPELQVWRVPRIGAAALTKTLVLDRKKIADDMNLRSLSDEATLLDGDLPKVWWNSFDRAVDVGLATSFELDAAELDLDAIVVVGAGDTESAELVTAHTTTGRLAVLAQGTPTNTVNGEATTELGRDPQAWFPLVAADPALQPGTDAVVRALTGASPAAMPLQGGGIDSAGAQSALVMSLWNVLWGRMIRDVTGATEAALAIWARENLAPEGAYPAIRVGEQPYGIVPATALHRWVALPGDPAGEGEIREWSLAWRASAALATEKGGNVTGAATDKLVAMLGETAPSRKWGVRFVASLAVARALRAAAGMPTVDTTDWDNAIAGALAGQPRPVHPLAPVSALYALPSEPIDRHDKADILLALLTRSPMELQERQDPLGLLGHLLREEMLLGRARIGLAFKQLSAGMPVDPDAPLPIFPPSFELITLITQGDDASLRALATSGDPHAREAAHRFETTRKSAKEVIDRWIKDPDRVFATLLAVLDTTNHRVDPWVMGIANRRLRALSAQGERFLLGAYGWVDRPQPAALVAGALPPGPTAAGLLHAPSHAQALTAALLRDAAIRHPGDARWNLTIESAKVRAALRLAERVRLGVHPYEALGLEVERLVGEWDAVRELRKAFPLRSSHQGNRSCDGVRVLNAVLRGAEPLPAGLPADLATTLAPLSQVLDTYGDLLVADGVHALVSGRADLANAAMEAAAGLGAPPELRAIKTPRHAESIRVSTWALLKVNDGDAIDDPAFIVDPAFAQLLDAELDTPSQWTWSLRSAGGSVNVSLADRGVHGVALIGLSDEAVEHVVLGASPPGTTAISTGGRERLAAATALAELLGGGDDNPPVPDLLSGRDDAKAADTPLRQAMVKSFHYRRQALIDRAVSDIAAIDGVDRSDAVAVADVLVRVADWKLGDGITLDTARAALNARIAASTAVPDEINALRRALRAFANAPRLPVLPVVNRVDADLPALLPLPTNADGRPSSDKDWLEIVAAVRPRLALLEAHQLSSANPWPAAVHTENGSTDPWDMEGPVVVAYGPAADGAGDDVAIATLDAWLDSIPSPYHTTSAAFGFNGPKSRAPQAILLAVPPDVGHRLTADELREVVLETRELAHARAARPDGVAVSRVATPSALVSTRSHISFLESWFKS
jgi:hypothetical protein